MLGSISGRGGARGGAPPLEQHLLQPMAVRASALPAPCTALPCPATMVLLARTPESYDALGDIGTALPEQNVTFP